MLEERTIFQSLTDKPTDGSESNVEKAKESNKKNVKRVRFFSERRMLNQRYALPKDRNLNLDSGAQNVQSVIHHAIVVPDLLCIEFELLM